MILFKLLFVIIIMIIASEIVSNFNKIIIYRNFAFFWPVPFYMVYKAMYKKL